MQKNIDDKMNDNPVYFENIKKDLVNNSKFVKKVNFKIISEINNPKINPQKEFDEFIKYIGVSSSSYYIFVNYEHKQIDFLLYMISYLHNKIRKMLVGHLVQLYSAWYKIVA